MALCRPLVADGGPDSDEPGEEILVNACTIVALVVSLAVLLASIAFAYWLWRKHGVVSAGWLLLYWVVGSSLFAIPLNRLLAWYINGIGAGRAVPFGWSMGTLLSCIQAVGWLFPRLSFACIGLLVASDVIATLEPEAEALLGAVGRLRAQHRLLGSAAIALRLVPFAVVGVLLLTT